mmetsp:Transcript_9799/g.14746  ORF Transcript_9799/g.14746 Transcript_9799/m.14746 type:complete len:156 (+) Transcript_9799:240-707(+)
MRVNSLGPLWLTQALFDALESNKNQSVVVFIGSVGGTSQSVLPGFRAADGMSKASIGYLTKLMAAEYPHAQTNFICLSPGAVDTEMFRTSMLNKMTEAERIEFIQKLPKGQLIEPNEIAGIISWLVNSCSKRILNGACIDASQGLSVRPGLLTEK